MTLPSENSELGQAQTSADRQTAHTPSRVLIGLGVVAVVIGALLPWASITAVFIGTISFAGTEGDGMLTLVGGLVAGAAAIPAVLLGRRLIWGLAILIMLAGAAIGFVAVYDMGNLQSAIGDMPRDVPAKASIGIGLWITLLGALSLISGGLWGGLSGANQSP